MRVRLLLPWVLLLVAIRLVELDLLLVELIRLAVIGVAILFIRILARRPLALLLIGLAQGIIIYVRVKSIILGKQQLQRELTSFILVSLRLL
jgi:hypothetical protein